VSKPPRTAHASGNPLWQPLAVPIFRAVWIAAIFSNAGTLMHQVGAAWLMTSMTSSPVLIGLLQTAATLPMFLVGLPAGVLADFVPRRTMLLWTQGWMLLVAAAISTATWLDLMTPWRLLALTFCLGLGFALSQPSFQANVHDLVPREMLSSAIALNSIAFNAARSVAPAIGGIVVAAAGSETVFFLNALSFIGMLAVFAVWRPPPHTQAVTKENKLGAIWTGLRYVAKAPTLHAPLIRVAAHMFCASAVLALLPLVARDVWKLDSFGYGMLLTAFGAMSIVSAGIVQKWRQRISVDTITGIAICTGGSALLILGITNSAIVAGVAMLLWGLSWTGTLINFNVAMQMGVDSWVRGRAMSIYLLVFMGSMAIGSAWWGWVASHSTPQTAFLLAGTGMIAAIALVLKWKLTAAHSEEEPSIPTSL